MAVENQIYVLVQVERNRGTRLARRITLRLGPYNMEVPGTIEAEVVEGAENTALRELSDAGAEGFEVTHSRVQPFTSELSKEGLTVWIVTVKDEGFHMHRLKVLVDAFSTRVPGAEGAKFTAQDQLHRHGAEVDLDQMEALAVDEMRQWGASRG